jgi:DNA-binding MarR family transcriptional regulator
MEPFVAPDLGDHYHAHEAHIESEEAVGMDTQGIRSATLPFIVLIDAGNVVQRALEKRLQHLGLSVAQQRILTLLLLAKEPLTPTLLAGALLQETHSVSGLLNRLEDRDLITRIRQRHDRRVVFVSLAPAGRSIAEQATQIVVLLAQEIRSGISAKNLLGVMQLLEGVRENGIKLAGADEKSRTEAERRVWG